MMTRWQFPVEGKLSEETSIQQQLLNIIANDYTGFFKASDPRAEVTWTLYFRDGKLTYASHSLEMTDRLDRHLRRWSKKIPQLTKPVRTEIFQTLVNMDCDGDASPDYRMIATLVSRQYLTEKQAGLLVKGLVEEVLESFLLLQEGTFRYLPALIIQPMFCTLKVRPLLEDCKHRHKQWAKLGAGIWSPYQRPYFHAQKAANEMIADSVSRKLDQILKGLSFRHLSVLLNRDEIDLIKSFLPLIHKQVITIQPPQSPYDRLPQVQVEASKVDEPVVNHDSLQLSADSIESASYTVACVDDSPSILQTIHRYLENDALNIVQISEPTKALLEIVRASPDLILMDVGMPEIDGYALCRMLRKNERFQNTPIVMVTGHTGLIDRAKAKLVGATDYMTKPFTQEGLNDMVFRYLSD